MFGVRAPGIQHDGGIQRIDPFIFGTLCGVISALAYTAANVFLRKVALDVDPFLASCVRASPMAMLGWGLVCLSAVKGQAVLPSGRLLLYLVLTGIFVQLGGNVAFQWSLRIVGLSIAIPLLFGTLIIAGAVMGRIWLSESVTPRSAVAMFILIAAIGLLSAGAREASLSVSAALPSSPDTWTIALGIGAACLSGLAYATAGVVIRRTVTRSIPVASTLVVIATMGVVINGPASLLRLGVDGLLATSRTEMADMLLAGLFNAVAFFALGKSLQLIRVVHVNALNASQTTLAALAGVVLFGEALSLPLVAGLGLMILGLVLMQGSERSAAEGGQRSAA